MLFTLFTTTLHLSLKLSYWLFPLRRWPAVVATAGDALYAVGGHLGSRKTAHALLSHVFGGLVCLVMCLLLFGVVSFASHSKPSTQAPAGLLHPVEIPHKHFEVWSMDFITDLPPCGGFNGIYTYIDELTKFVKLIPVSIREGALSALKVARFSLSMLCNCLASLVWFYMIVMLILKPTFGAFCGNYWVLGLHYLWPTIHSWMGRLNILIRQWNRLSTVFYGLVQGFLED